jgi:hypothetical protein
MDVSNAAHFRSFQLDVRIESLEYANEDPAYAVSMAGSRDQKLKTQLRAT